MPSRRLKTKNRNDFQILTKVKNVKCWLFRHNSLSPTCQDRFERRFSEIDKNNDGLIDQREIQRELETRQQNIPYKEIRYATQPSNQPISNGFKDGIFIRYSKTFVKILFFGFIYSKIELKNPYKKVQRSKRPHISAIASVLDEISAKINTSWNFWRVLTVSKLICHAAI